MKPSLPIANIFKATDETSRGLIEQNNKEIKNLSDLRNLLLPKLISGELPIKNLDKVLELS